MSSKPSKIQDKDCLPLFIGYLPEFALKKCKEELNESPERKVKALQELRALLEKNEKTSGIDFHEDFLVQYLRRNKYRLRDTFQHLLNFVILNKKETNLFNSTPDHYLETASSRTILLLPKRCPEGCAVAIFQIATWNPKELPFEYFKQIGVMTFLQLLRDPMNQVNGFKFIHDFQGTFSFLKYCTPQNLYLLYNFTINCIPGRYKEIHIITIPG
ncbi:Retinaldehyde-binding protein 1 like protein [Argiope bruennichi]|uniref:Retinaldehyde-binding protein 1 like protein n=1 Tax=Argiope bruennichi TaxID=94029 RepID=A0A8T0ESG0_ARGBR|nr:Retinaldehyde-binding protein 1 like protein [Argiope bruennichi]